LPAVMSISPTRLIDDPSMAQSRSDFKTALLPYGVRQNLGCDVRAASHRGACAVPT
jgi:hypothetical protein